MTGSRRTRPRRTGFVVASALFVISLVTSTGVAAASASGQVGPGQVVRLGAPGVALHVPPDGRLAGYGFTAQVVGTAFVDTAGTSSQPVSAYSGESLCVFKILWTLENVDSTYVGAYGSDGGGAIGGAITPSLPQADVVIGATQVPVTLPTPPTNFADSSFETGIPEAATYAVGDPAGKPVIFSVTSGGLIQSFNLSGGKRTNSDPPILYRDPTNIYVLDHWNVVQKMTVTDTKWGDTGTFTLTANGGELSWYLPGNTAATPLKPGDAFFVPSFTVTPIDKTDLNAPGLMTFGEFSPLPTSDVTLALPDGTVVASQCSNCQSVNVVDAAGIMDGEFYFEVPADFTAGTIAVNPGTIGPSGFSDMSGAGTETAVFAAPASFPISFPAPQPPPRPATSVINNGGDLGPAPSISTTAPAGRSGFIGLLGWIGLALVCVLAFVAIRWARRPDPRAVYPWIMSYPSPEPPAPLAIPTSLGRLLPAAMIEARIVTIDDKPADTTDDEVPTPCDAANASEKPTDARMERSVEAAATPRSAFSQIEDRVPGQPIVAQEGFDLTVGVLGPVGVVGWREPPTRRAVSDMIVYLVAHPGQTIAFEKIVAALWADSEKEPSPASRRSYRSFVRKALPKSVELETYPPGHRLLGPVFCDWWRFRELVGKAEADRVGAPAYLTEALTLVRGAPFESDEHSTYDWAVRELIVDEILTAVERASLELAAICRDAGDAKGTAWALRQGLIGCPHSFELHSKRIAYAWNPTERERALRAARAALGADAPDPDELGV